MTVWAIIGFIALVFISAVWSKPTKRKRARTRRAVLEQPKRPEVQLIYSLSPEPMSRPKQNGESHWVPPGRQTDIKKFQVADGMVYVGRGLGSSAPAPFIDISLPIASADPDIDGSQMPYWPSYSAIDPRCRLAYLQWLSGGKSAVEYSIGYVFLYFYGLERRIFAEACSSSERKTLANEIRRLRDIYGKNGSFDRYSAALLDAVEFKSLYSEDRNNDQYAPDLSSPRPDMGLGLKLAIARKVAKDERLEFNLAAAGFLSLPIVAGGPRLRIGATKSWAEFLALLELRFSRTFPEGLKLRNKKSSHLRLVYRSAARSTNVALIPTAETRGLPDPEDLSWTKMTDIVEKAMDELAPYAKFVSRHPGRARTLEALAVLPKELRDREIEKNYGEQLTWLESLPKPVARVPLPELSHRLLAVEDGDLRQQVAMSEFLESFGYGIEPNPLTAKSRLSPDAVVSIFYFGKRASSAAAERPEYRLGTSIATVVAGLGAASESGLGEDELKWLGWIAQKLKLDEVEALRLRAHVQWLASRKLTSQQLRKAIAAVPLGERNEIAKFTCHVAAADGVVEKSEIAFLEKIYAELGVDGQLLYQTLHDITAGRAMPAIDPVIVEQGSKKRNGRVIPGKGPGERVNGLRDDKANIARIIDETKQVADILSKIFISEEDESEASASTHSSTEESRFPGLDKSFARLLSLLVDERSEIVSKANFDRRAKEMGLMPGGALEAINEWAYDQFGEAAIEEADHDLQLNLELLG